jgi:putative membrane protein
MTKQQQALSQQDRHFVMEAVRGGTAEVKLSQLVDERASRDEVKQFGKHMIRDHTQANKELKRLASGKGETVSEELDEKHEKLMKRLSGLSGDEFDREYIKAMVQDHKKVVAEFEREASQGQDEDLKHWAGKILPKLQQHLQMAQDLVKQH